MLQNLYIAIGLIEIQTVDEILLRKIRKSTYYGCD